MRKLFVCALPLVGGLFLAGCSSPRPLPKFEKPLARAAVMSVRTTAYTHTEADHVKYANRNALGGRLQCGAINSAAADWSRWPAGSIFRIRETGEIFQVDDYGWALAGTNTIDLYKPSRAAMNAWGVRRITLENLRWGDPQKSLAVLRPRSRYRHIKRMVDQLEERTARRSETFAAEPALLAETAPPPLTSELILGDGTPAPSAAPVPPPLTTVTLAQPVRPAPRARPTSTTATREAFLNSAR